MVITEENLLIELQKNAKKNNINLHERLNYHISYWFNPFVKTMIGQYKMKKLLFGIFPIKVCDINYDFPVDMVYLWVDGSDTKWQEKKQFYLSKEGFLQEQSIADGRFIDNEELKYSLRSLEIFAPWINKIYIVTDNQVPKWLNLNHPKIEVVYHTNFIPEENLPLFNSNAIESYLPFIPNLSEHFIYGCDDFYFNKPVTKSFFFMPNGFPIVRLKRQIKKKHIKTSTYSRGILKNQKLIEKRFHKSIHYAPHHNIDAYLKQDYIDCLSIFEKEYKNTKKNKFRKESDIQRPIVLYYALAIGHAKLKRVRKVDSYLPTIRKILNRISGHNNADSMCLSICRNDLSERVKRNNPTLFCTNDGEGCTNSNRENLKHFLAEHFPQKSKFEL